MGARRPPPQRIEWWVLDPPRRLAKEPACPKTGSFRMILRAKIVAKNRNRCTRARVQAAKLLILKEMVWRRGWDSNSSSAFRICKLQKLRCRECHECRRCRRALPAIAR